jgi:hypothetical protein
LQVDDSHGEAPSKKETEASRAPIGI